MHSIADTVRRGRFHANRRFLRHHDRAPAAPSGEQRWKKTWCAGRRSFITISSTRKMTRSAGTCSYPGSSIPNRLRTSSRSHPDLGKFLPCTRFLVLKMPCVDHPTTTRRRSPRGLPTVLSAAVRSACSLSCSANPRVPSTVGLYIDFSIPALIMLPETTSRDKLQLASYDSVDETIEAISPLSNCLCHPFASSPTE